MKMDFYGNFTHRLDGKGRVSIPSKYRKILEERYNCLKLMVNLADGGLTAYPLAEWENFKQHQLSTLDLTTPEGRKKRRRFAGNAEQVEVDAQGRILLSSKLQEQAGMAKGEEVIIVGVIDIFELWQPQRWEEENE